MASAYDEIMGAIAELEKRDRDKANVRNDTLSGQQFHQPALFHTLRAEGGTDFQYIDNSGGHAAENVASELRFLPVDPKPIEGGNITEFTPNTDDPIMGRFGMWSWPKNPADQRAVGERIIANDQQESQARGYSGFPEILGGRAPAAPSRPEGVEWSESTGSLGQVKRSYRSDEGLKVGEVNYTPGTEHGNLVHTAEVHPGYRRMGLSNQFREDFIKEHPDTYADAYTQEGAAAFKRKGIPEIP